MIARTLLLTFAALAAIAPVHASLTITEVQPDRTRLDPARNETVTVRFRISDAAFTTLHIYDGRGIEVRRVDSTGQLPPGQHELAWDGRDWRGRDVPPEAYVYALSAKASDGQEVEFDLTDITGGETLTPRDVKWDVTTGRITYVLDRPARVNIRLGLQNDGPLLRTLIDWVPRASGLQSEPWDGFDASHALNFSAHPSLAIGVNAFSLPDNAIFVGEPPALVKLIDELPDPVVRRRQVLQVKHMYDHAQQPLESRGDYVIRLELPQDLKLRDGLPVINTAVPLTIEAGKPDRARVISRRFEPVYFIDGQFVFENEMGFLPMTWVWDPAAISEGVHYVTVNLRGYEGNFGMATRKVYVEHGRTER